MPPPYTHLYSAGGPTGEVHSVDVGSGGFGQKIQQLLFVHEDKLEAADKTRAALRYGSHAVEISPQGYAFIPVLGTNSIEMYALDRVSGELQHLSSNPSAHLGDGPRHIVVSSDGTKIYSVGEHSNTLDIFDLDESQSVPRLKHVVSRSLLPSTVRTPPADVESTLHNPLYRGDTLRLLPATAQNPVAHHIIATTRGARSGVRGWLSVFQLDANGLFAHFDHDDGERESGVERYETPTSGGKANAIDILPKQPVHEDGGFWILLTDDDEDTFGTETGTGLGAVRVLEWDDQGGGVRDVVAWPSSIEERDNAAQGGENMRGGSHAVWLD